MRVVNIIIKCDPKRNNQELFEFSAAAGDVFGKNAN